MIRLDEKRETVAISGSFFKNWRLENIGNVLDHFFGITGKVQFFALVDAKNYNWAWNTSNLLWYCTSGKLDAAKKRVEKIRYTTTVPYTIGHSCGHIIASRNELKQPNAFFPRQFFTCLSIFSSEKYHLIKHIYLIWLLNFIGNSSK